MSHTASSNVFTIKLCVYCLSFDPSVECASESAVSVLYVSWNTEIRISNCAQHMGEAMVLSDYTGLRTGSIIRFGLMWPCYV